MFKLVFVSSRLTVLVLLTYCTTISRSQNNPLCNSSSCGDIKISYPFRLRTDPANCGHSDPIFMLDCRGNQTIMNSKSRKSYHVQAITYSNFSARISDPGLDTNNQSSCPIYSSTDNDLYSRYMFLYSTNSIVVTFLNCLSPVSNPLYIENPFCGNTSAFSSNSSRIHSYVTVGSILVWDLEEFCTYDTMAEASSPSPLEDDNYTYSQIHDLLAYGFEVSWYYAMCTKCEEDKGSCTLEDNKIHCRHYCYEDTPLSERSFLCKLEYYAPYLMLVAMAIGGLVALRFVFGIPFLIGLVVYKWKTRHSSLRKSENIEELITHQVNLTTTISYTYSEIKKMTSNFKTKLGGTVYKGNLRSGPSIAIKMLTDSSAPDNEFIAHISAISRISHPNITRLIGFCIQGKKRALVHEFIQCGSLEKHMMNNPSLSYADLFKVSLGIARGIEFLHGNGIFNLGIKPQNILLDEEFNPRISGYGLAKLYSDRRVEALNLRAGKGKMGFVAPEVFYGNIGEISSKADVYSFGMLVLEMAARKQSLNPCAEKLGQVYFPFWVYKELSEGRELEFMGDAGVEEREMVKKMMIVGLWCIQIRAGDRPLMNEVVAMLQGEIQLLQMPPLPFQVME